jgi:DNA-binding transcriptional MerR regulator
MTIKEIETLSRMNWANIRFYEREGLITPNRMGNGNRDYSEAELQILLRIKLLRSIRISLDEIKELKNGNINLVETLSKQIAELQKEKRLSYALEVCGVMLEDGVTFADFDAKKYLLIINSATRESGSWNFTFTGEELPRMVYPWRRFLARTMDIVIYNLIWSLFLIFAFHVNLANRINIEIIFDSFLSLVIMLLLEPLLLRLFGSTLGKAIFGIRIETPDGRRLSYTEGMERTWGVVSAGMGFNIPIYNLVRLWKSYKLCSENRMQSWDVDISYTIKDTKGYRGALLVGAYAVIFAVLATALSAHPFPPNRGDLTIAEFVENYNYYAKFYDVNFGNEYLDENGKWVEKEFDGVVYISFNEMPEYNFTIENGTVTEVFFVVERKNNQDWFNSYDTQMVLASLAFAGAQNEMGLFSKVPNQIREQINNNTLEDFNFFEFGIEFTCDTEHYGYKGTPFGVIVPDENVTENYFRLQFSMNKK